MKVIIALVVTAIVDIEEDGVQATVNMLPPKMNRQAIIPMCTDPSEAKDLTIIAAAHVLNYLSNEADKERNDIGEPAVFGQSGGQA